MTIQPIDEPKSGSSNIIRHGIAVIGAAIIILIKELWKIGNFFGNSPKSTARNRMPEIMASWEGWKVKPPIVIQLSAPESSVFVDRSKIIETR